jgi:hypothetical protein
MDEDATDPGTPRVFSVSPLRPPTMSRSIVISALEARISKEERKCEEEQLQLATLQEEENTLRQRLKEMPKAKARLSSKIGGRKANVKKMKLEAYELLRTQLTRAPSEPEIRPAAARSHSRSAKLDDGTKDDSSDAAGPDPPRPPPPVVAPTATSTNVKKRPRAPSPTDSDIVEVPPPMKREASPIRVTSLKLHGYTFTDVLVGLGTKLARVAPATSTACSRAASQFDTRTIVHPRTCEW